MTPIEIFRSALRGVLANRMRSALTMLGLVIGVASVIVLVAVGNGASNAVRQEVEALGTNAIYVMPQTQNQGRTGARSQMRNLTLDDAKALVDHNQAPDVVSSAPVAMTTATAVNGENTNSQQIVGTSAAYLVTTNATYREGSGFTADDDTASHKVAVLGATTADALFPTGEAVGKDVRINGIPFSVVGVLEAKGGGFGSDPDDTVIVPMGAARSHLVNPSRLSMILVQARDANSAASAEQQITQILNQRHRVTDPQNADFRIISANAVLEASDTLTGLLTLLLAAVAAISLLVGGIGVTNIMLVSVTERTREIGIRKAIGAGKGAIMGQFLGEATLLSIGGGLIGVAVGLLLSRIPLGPIQPQADVGSVMLSFGVAVAIGLFFGSYPANRAANMRPIDALRYE